MKPREPIPESTLQCFVGLVERWEDEWEYEDFNEYKKVMAANLPAGAQLKSMTMRPFRAVFEWNGEQRFMRAQKRRDGALDEVVYGVVQ